MDAIYLLNHVVNREMAKKGRLVFFADLKTAFNRVDRREMDRMLKSRDKGTVKGKNNGNI